MPTNKKRIMINVDQELYENLEKAKDYYGLNMASMVVFILTEYFRNNKIQN